MGLGELTRFVQFACALGLFGTAAWQQIHPPQSPALRPAQPEDWPLVLYALGSLLGVAGTMGWLLAEAKGVGGAWSAVGDLITSTRFGQVALARAALLFFSALTVWAMRRSRRLWRVLTALTASAVMSFIWTGHGTAGVGLASSLHIVADALHLLCAGLWVGALIMLSASAARALAKGARSSAMLLAALSRFSAVGPAVIGLLVVTGCINTWLLVGAGHWGELLRQPYGWTLIVKLALFAAMLALARQHRYRSTRALRQALADDQASALVLKPVRYTLLAETLLAFLVLAAVAVLGNLEPPASLSQA